MLTSDLVRPVERKKSNDKGEDDDPVESSETIRRNRRFYRWRVGGAGTVGEEGCEFQADPESNSALYLWWTPGG